MRPGHYFTAMLDINSFFYPNDRFINNYGALTIMTWQKKSGNPCK